MNYSQPAFYQSLTCPLILCCSSDPPSDRHDQIYHCVFCMSNVKEPWNKGLTGTVKSINLPLECRKKFTSVLYCFGVLFFSYVEVEDKVEIHKFFLYYIHAETFVRLPSRPTMTNESKLAFGFGFHPGTNEYKVVRIVEQEQPLDLEQEQPLDLEQEQPVGLEQHIEVFTLGKPMWQINRKNPFLLRMQRYAALFNGALHWLGQDKQNGSTIIVSFDLESEEFRQIPTPDNCDKSGLVRQDCHVVVLGGCLCVVDYDEFDRIDIWSMKIYGAKESWIKEYTVEPLDGLRAPIRPLYLLPNRNILIEFQYLHECFYVYSVDSMAVYKIRIRDLCDLPPCHSFRAVSVVDDIVM